MAAEHEPKSTAAEQAARIEAKLDLNFQLTHGWTAEQVQEVVAATPASARAALIAQYTANAEAAKAAKAAKAEPPK